MEAPIKVRIDKWLWAVRLFKTRGLAAEACDKDKIRINDLPVKASRIIKPGDEITLHRGAWHQQVKVLQLNEHRMPAKLAREYCVDITPVEELKKLKQYQDALAAWNLKSGAGRPTKKDRRDMDHFRGFND